jgi:hypothetical protein
MLSRHRIERRRREGTTMTENHLERLSHESLVQNVGERLSASGSSRASVSADVPASRYLRNESVPVAQIHPYPKRHRAAVEFVTITKVVAPSASGEMTYADFLRIPERLSNAV